MPRIQKLRRVAAIGFLFAIPLTVLWNLAAEQIAPRLVLHVAQLNGVTEPPPRLRWSWDSFAHGTLQTAIARAVSDAAALRPLMIRINDEISYTLFGEISTPTIVEGDERQLIERATLDEYCARGPDTVAHRARQLIPKLRDIQSYYAERNRLFLYVITPSKAAHLPELFLRHVRCNNSVEDRAAKLPTMVRLLREAGVNVLDTASLIHGLKSSNRVDLFPRGGLHWNSLAAAYAADAVVAELDRLEIRPPIPRLRWRYEVVGRAEGSDRDLADLMNLLVPRVWYPVPEMTFLTPAPCGDLPSARLDVALVGDSFSEGLADALRRGACLSQLYIYRYLMIRHGGPADSWKLTPNESDIAPIRDAEVVILEENEGFAVEGNYVARLRALVAGK